MIKNNKENCCRCFHEWKSKLNPKDIVVCPKCHSPYWNVERGSRYTD